MGHARIRGSRGWVTARGHPAVDCSRASPKDIRIAMALLGTMDVGTALMAAVRCRITDRTCTERLQDLDSTGTLANCRQLECLHMNLSLSTMS